MRGGVPGVEGSKLVRVIPTSDGPWTRATAASWFVSVGSKDVSTRPWRARAPSPAGRAAYCGRLPVLPPLNGAIPEGPQNTSSEKRAKKAVLAPAYQRE